MAVRPPTKHGDIDAFWSLVPEVEPRHRQVAEVAARHADVAPFVTLIDVPFVPHHRGDLRPWDIFRRKMVVDRPRSATTGQGQRGVSSVFNHLPEVTCDGRGSGCWGGGVERHADPPCPKPQVEPSQAPMRSWEACGPQPPAG